jgi:hypothetical protein
MEIQDQQVHSTDCQQTAAAPEDLMLLVPTAVQAAAQDQTLTQELNLVVIQQMHHMDLEVVMQLLRLYLQQVLAAAAPAADV